MLVVSQVAGLALVGTMWLATQPAAADRRATSRGESFAGVMGVVGLAAFYRALAVGTMGIVGPISATGAIVPVVYGLARGERPSVLQAVGIVVAVIGVVAASLEPLPEGAGRKLATGVGLALIAALGFGCVAARPEPRLAGRRRVGDADAAADRRPDRARRGADSCGRRRRSSGPVSRSSSRSGSSTPARTCCTARPRATD